MSPFARPSWLGTRSLPTRPDGYGEVQPTPPELRDRQLETLDLLPPPGGSEFQWTIEAVPDEVVLRSTWGSDCPVSRDELAYVTISHFGFDGGFHTGELLVNADAASGLVAVFRRLHEDRFPIEQMRVIHAEELNEPPTGDGNVTTSFVCRPAVGSTRWSQHAFGLAVDINPFHNPYSKGDLVLPELATAYTDRTEVRSGMVVPGDVVTDAFVDIGWGWGGNWNTLKDWMHFSRNGN
ncbi:MAG: M15 family metallopeptidase [Acidimicrobiia bacterium]